MTPVTEAELRTQLRVWLAPRSRSAGARLIEEFGIERGAARIDIALVGRELEAYEIKSDLDTFARMSNQIHAFNRVFDRLWLVTGPAHAQVAEKIIPRWWGIVTGARRADSTLDFTEVRSAEVNPSRDPISLAMLLWRDEALKLVTEMGLGPVSKRATRSELGERLASTLDLDALQRLVACAIGRREPIAALP